MDDANPQPERAPKSDEPRWVVGVDGSPHAAHAARWARRNALAQVSHLRLVTAWSIPPLAFCSPMAGMHPDLGRRLQASAQEVVERAATEIGCTDGLHISTEVVRGRPAPALLDAAETAELLVVGTRGQTGFQAFALGSTAARVAAHAATPVAVVPHSSPVDQPDHIVVAVDGSPHSIAALDWAIGIVRPDAEVVVVTVDDGTAGFSEPHDGLSTIDALGAVVEAAVERRFVERDERIAVEVQVSDGSARQVVLDATDGADLLVVGRRGHGLAGSLRLGSVSHWLLAHSPVAVVAVPRTFDPGSPDS